MGMLFGEGLGELDGALDFCANVESGSGERCG